MYSSNSIQRDRPAPRNTGLSRVTVRLLYARAAFARRPWRAIGAPIHLLTWAWLLLLGAEIPAGTRIGKDLRLPHGGRGVIIHPRAVIGDNVTLYHRVTIGVRGTAEQAPNIGSGTYVGTGATIIGEINVGENSRIGAGAVVIDDVPANSTATGVPATIRTTRPIRETRNSAGSSYELPSHDQPTDEE